jgi:hypothetical protein
MVLAEIKIWVVEEMKGLLTDFLDYQHMASGNKRCNLKSLSHRR